jgi:hypothetical protein
MTMICCTLTGVDRNTSPARLGQLAHKFPKAEFGILFSPERSGLQNRFQTFSEIQSMLDAGQLQWAIHLCGRAVPEFIRAAVSQSAEERNCESFRLATHPAVSRIQLNFAFRRAAFSLSELEAAIRSVSIPVITQEHRANEGFHSHSKRRTTRSSLTPPAVAVSKRPNGCRPSMAKSAVSPAAWARRRSRVRSQSSNRFALTNPSGSIWKHTSGTRTTGLI